MILRQARVDDAANLLYVHLRSRATAMPWLAVVHTPTQTREWLANVVLTTHDVWVAEVGDAILGYVALSPGWIEHLYVIPGSQSGGLGRQLLDHAKQRSPDGLLLFTFARNTRARRFYEAAGFTLIATSDGSSNEEREPDCTYRWVGADNTEGTVGLGARP